jgi:hypothetical protein
VATCVECLFDWDLSGHEACGVIGGFGDAYQRALVPFMGDPESVFLRKRPAPWSMPPTFET